MSSFRFVVWGLSLFTDGLKVECHCASALKCAIPMPTERSAGISVPLFPDSHRHQRKGVCHVPLISTITYAGMNIRGDESAWALNVKEYNLASIELDVMLLAFSLPCASMLCSRCTGKLLRLLLRSHVTRVVFMCFRTEANVHFQKSFTYAVIYNKCFCLHMHKAKPLWLFHLPFSLQ